MISPVDILQHEDGGADYAADNVAEGQVQYVHVCGVISGALGEQIQHFEIHICKRIKIK